MTHNTILMHAKCIAPRLAPFIMAFLLIGCYTEEAETQTDTTGTSDANEESPNETGTVPPETTAPTEGIVPKNERTTYIFGHSLIVHDPPAIATPSNETTVPHWMASFALHQNTGFSVAGQYGFLPQHDNLPPFSQWGFDLAAGAWDSDTQPFSEAGFESILLTAGNFIQDQPADENYFNENISPIGATLDIFDWVVNEAPGADLYIYENWPDMASFITGEAFPPNPTELADYNEFTQNDFHQWWLAYHDALRNARPERNIKMIPVGPILSKLYENTNVGQIPITELYEDNAPHGRPTLYFLAGLTTYMAMYRQKLPDDYPVPNTVHPNVGNHLATIIDYIWEELTTFTTQDGESRVF